jgi:type II secretory pathway pseudopilin PulG
VQTGPHKLGHRADARAFTLIDLLVSMAVIMVLIGLLTPVVSMARNAALRAGCASHVRQLGLACQMFAYDRSGKVPTSQFSGTQNSAFQKAPLETVLLRIDSSSGMFTGPAASAPKFKNRWDGLGLLQHHEYVDAPEVFYCPRETSEHTLDRYRPRFDGQPGEIAGNYQLRLPDPKKYLSDLDPAMAIIANAMRSVDEYSHKTGNNMLLADMSVQWFSDGARLMAYLHPAGRTDSRGGADVADEAWSFLDQRRVPVSESDRDPRNSQDGTESTDQIDKSKKAGSSG